MIGRGLLLLTVLSDCVLSLPVTSSQLENEDVEVMKCIVEALADVLSRPKQVPVSQECLNTLRTDEKLLTILRHHNFLKELQELAAQGDQERVQLQKYTEKPTPATQALHTPADAADQSMLEALGGPGERSILSQRKRAGDSREKKDETGEESVEDSESEEEHVKRDEDENQGEAEHDENQTSSEENSEEENDMEDKKGDLSNKKRDPSRENPKQKVATEDEDKSNKRSAHFLTKHDGKEEDQKQEQKVVKRGSRESLNHLTQRAKTLPLKKKAGREEEPQLGSQQEVSHHSKEEAKEEQQKKKRDPERSPEERELQMIARRAPEERKVMEEEGSGSRKSEEPEIESLAAIESELENVAQKLHQLRRG